MDFLKRDVDFLKRDVDFLKRDVDKLERVQRQGARWAKGAHGVVSVSGILRELGWKELASRRKE